jgi:hypothetical protein
VSLFPGYFGVQYPEEPSLCSERRGALTLLMIRSPEPSVHALIPVSTHGDVPEWIIVAL